MTTQDKTKALAAVDLLFSIVLALGSIWVIQEASRLRVFGSFYDAPGFFPFVMGWLILIGAVALMFDAIKRGGIKQMKEKRKELGQLRKHESMRRLLVLVALIGIYGFVLVPNMHYTLASTLFLVSIFLYLRSLKWYYTIALSVGVSVGISLVFHYALKIPLP
ncbi:MAG: tripartite tricarboxylate transporter TctB family protein [Limnochordia bacterium]|jgi:hypothetical protein